MTARQTSLHLNAVPTDEPAVIALHLSSGFRRLTDRVPRDVCAGRFLHHGVLKLSDTAVDFQALWVDYFTFYRK